MYANKKLLLTPVKAGEALDYKPQTTRNKMTAGKFPVPIVVVDGRKMVRAIDLKQFVDNLPEMSPKPCKKKRGAPAKAERIARTGKDMKVWRMGERTK
ncbi:MAG: hypothetical protein Q8O64_21225 [Sideroxyarcus sp.]|nr:hypothetical protein [Sideroxyarcus sp.]